jgi:hypothetical protein
VISPRIKVVIPSSGRAATIGEHTLALMPYAYVSVDESEVDDYAQVVEGERILPHPPMGSVIEIQNWLHDWHAADGAEFMIVAYDDLTNVRNLVGWRARTYRDPALIAQLFEVTAQCASDAGCPLFGFGHHQTKPFYPHMRPFKLNGYVRNVLGFAKGFDLRWDPYCALHGDVDLALQALRKHRIIWRDDRWVFGDAPMASNRGGQSSRRSKEQMDEADAKLIRKWGRRYVRVKTRRHYRNVGSRTQSTVISVRRRDPELPS